MNRAAFFCVLVLCVACVQTMGILGLDPCGFGARRVYYFGAHICVHNKPPEDYYMDYNYDNK